MTIVTPEPTINRDRWGRPLIIPPGGGKPVAYQRCTSYIDVLEDKFNLQKWSQRMVALGLASRPDLLLSVSAHRDDKRELDTICEKAREASAASASATTGTALHALTEVIDRGEALPPLPEGAKASLAAYATATSVFKALHIERFLVQDPLQIGGTADRIVDHNGVVKIADTKTGSIEYGALKIAMQLAVYARSSLYDVATGEREYHHASLDEGIIIHLPATDDPAKAECKLYAVDLQAGWRAVQVAKQVRHERKRKFSDLITPLGTTATSAPVEPVEWRGVHTTSNPPTIDQLARMIAACATADDVRALWSANAATWTDALTEAAKAHITKLPAAS